MFKMIIADDEPLTRQGIRESVNWSLMDIEIVAEASNGLEAMMYIHEYNPDIIICDIKMPKLDGISLINEVQASHPNLQVLFLSGYSDKEYLRHAIRLTAVDYIFKPFQLHELIAAIEKAKKNCSKEASLSYQPNDLALWLLQQDLCDKENAELKKLPIKTDSTLASIIIKFNSESIRLSENPGDNIFDAQVAAGRYYNHFFEASRELFGDSFVLSSVGAGYVIHANVPPDFLVSGKATARLLKYIDVSQKIGIEKELLNVGVSNLCSPPTSSLRESYAQARDAISASFLTGCGTVILYRDLNHEPFVPYADLQESFYDKITSNQISKAISRLDSYISYMSCCRISDIPLIKEVLVSISFWLEEKINEFSVSKTQIIEKINYSHDLKSAKEHILNLINKYVQDVTELDNKGRILLEVERYIMENYDKDLSIKTLASKVYITPNYLCYLYKQKTKRTINQFILDVKMEKAKNMLCDTAMRLCDIADALDYKSQNYFTRIFTSYYGVSPRAYRNSGGRRIAVAEEQED